jgi:hypothetical protein
MAAERQGYSDRPDHVHLGRTELCHGLRRADQLNSLEDDQRNSMCACDAN